MTTSACTTFSLTTKAFSKPCIRSTRMSRWSRAASISPGRETLLKKKLEQAQHDFDFVLLDCPPSLGLLTLNALAVASEVIIPMQPHFLAMQGMAKLLDTVRLVNKQINPRLRIGGIVLTMFDAQTKLSAEVVSELEGFFEQ